MNCKLCEEPAHVLFTDGKDHKDTPVCAGCVDKYVAVGGKDYSYTTVPVPTEVAK